VLELSTSFHRLDGSVLKALCLEPTGRLVPSEIDLIKYYGNPYGSSREAGKDWILVREKDGLKLMSEADSTMTEVTNLSINIVNINGALVYEQQ
jgi:hypothetical protein